MNELCRWTRERLEDSLHNEPSANEAAKVDDHIADCEKCSAYRSALLDDDTLLAEYARSINPNIERMEENIMKSIGESIGQFHGREISKDAAARKIFGYRAVKIAIAIAAALVVVIGYNGLFRNGPVDIAWASVIARVQEAQDYICRIDRESIPWDSTRTVAYFSKEHGQKKLLYQDEKLAAEIYVRPGERKTHLIHHLDEAYVTFGLTSEEAKRFTDLTSAQDLVEHFRSFEYEEIGKRRIGDTTASGIEVNDPAMWAGHYEDGYVRLWVDQETLWPVLIER